MAEGAEMDDTHCEDKTVVRKMDDDGSLAKELQRQIFQGDPEDGGVVWPRIAEISLLGGLGCGRALVRCSVFGQGKHSRMRLGFMMLELKPGHACDPMTCLSGVHFLTVPAINCVSTLKAEATLEELECSASVYDYAVLQATDNSVCCSFLDGFLHSRMPLVPTPVRLKRACV
jgi:hypothetical protein